MIKKIKYIIKLDHVEPTSVKWSFESGDLFKSNNGSWVLENMGDGKTRVTYSLEVEIKGFAPKMVVDKLVKTNLPAMMQSCYERAKSV